MPDSEPATAVRIREASFSDHPKIVELQLRNNLSPSSYADWSALWKGNPAYRAGDPIGWVIEGPGGELGGYAGSLPLAYQFNGLEVRAATVYSWAADAPYRGYSLALLGRILKQEHVDLFVCTTANATAARAYKALQFSKVPAGAWDKSGFWITGYQGFAKSALIASAVPMRNALAHPVAAVLRAQDLFRKSPAGSGDCEFVECSTFDARFERFWEELKAENPGRLLAVRTPEALGWHYRRAKLQRDAHVITASKNGRLLAYAAFDRQDHPALELKRIRIIDFQAVDGHANLLRPALKWILNHCRRDGVHILENVGCWLERFQAVAPYQRSLKSWVFYYKSRVPELSRHLQNPDVWVPSSFDGDASI